MVTKGLHIPSGTTLAQFGAAVEAEAPELFTGPFSWPVMTIDVDALEHNLSGMAQFCARNGFALAPHVKTHMSRELWDRQRDAGAWGPTVANATQLRTVLDWGARQILVANQMLDPRDLTHLAQMAGRAGGSDPLQVWVYADSRAGVEVLARHLAAPGVREHIGVLVELGHAGGRTGARTVDEVVAVARAAEAAGLRVVGVSAYEGSIGFGAAPAELEAVGRFCTDLLTAAEAIAPVVGSERPVLSVGGSAYLDVVESVLAGPHVAGRVRVVVRSGAYLTHDHGVYARADPWSRMPREARLRPALRLWAQVHSIPEPGLVICGAGRRDAPFDADLPLALRAHHPSGTAAGRDVSGTTFELNDQHLFWHSEDEVEVGDVIEFGISHPCTAFDKWRTIPLLAGTRVQGLVHTEF